MGNNRKIWFWTGIIAGFFFCSAVLGFCLAIYRQRDQVKTLVKSEYWKYLVRKGNSRIGSTEKGEDIDEYPDKAITIAVDPSNEIARVDPMLYGATLSPQIETEPDIIEFAKDVGMKYFRFPGGGSPGYHWKKGSFDFEDRLVNVPLRDINNVIDFCKKTNTKIIAQVNLESGSPQEAAEWVTYMNKTANFPVKYWELGNEVYADWDRGYMSGDRYAKLVKEYAVAMKKADPTIKIGMDWAPERRRFFNYAVVKKAGKYIDFVSFHWYPNDTSAQHMFESKIHPTPKEVMANYLQVPVFVKRVQGLFARYVPFKKDKIEVALLEWDGAWDAPSYDTTPSSQGIMQWSQANAIFFADCLGTFAKHGIQVSTPHTFQALGFGFIRGWDKNAGYGGERWDGRTIRPKALAVKLFSRYFGDILIGAEVRNSPSYYKKADWWPDSYTGRVPYITAYASRFSHKKGIALVIINKHAEKEYRVKIDLGKISPNDEAKLYVLNGPDIAAENEGNPGNVQIEAYKIQNVKNTFMYTVPAHSVNLIEIEEVNANIRESNASEDNANYR